VKFLWLLLLGVASLVCGCSSVAPFEFRITDASDRPVAGAHARIIALDAGTGLPVSKRSLEDVAMARETSGGFSDRDGRIVLPVLRGREHLIELEGPSLGSAGLPAPVSVWVYRAADGAVARTGQSDDALRINPVP
jgi:hypothetical protein